VISVPKRLRCFLADRPAAVRALTKIFLAEIERLLCAAAGVTFTADALPATHPRFGAVSLLHRFGSALNRHVHLHLCATDGVFVPNGDGPPAFLPAHPITQVHLVTLTERVRRRVIRWFRLAHMLDASAAADMFAWENSGFSLDASVRIALCRPQLRAYCQSLEHLLRYCAWPPFTLERFSVTGHSRRGSRLTPPRTDKSLLPKLGPEEPQQRSVGNLQWAGDGHRSPTIAPPSHRRAVQEADSCSSNAEDQRLAALG